MPTAWIVNGTGPRGARGGLCRPKPGGARTLTEESLDVIAASEASAHVRGTRSPAVPLRP